MKAPYVLPVEGGFVGPLLFLAVLYVRHTFIAFGGSKELPQFSTFRGSDAGWGWSSATV